MAQEKTMYFIKVIGQYEYIIQMSTCMYIIDMYIIITIERHDRQNQNQTHARQPIILFSLI